MLHQTVLTILNPDKLTHKYQSSFGEKKKHYQRISVNDSCPWDEEGLMKDVIIQFGIE